MDYLKSKLNKPDFKILIDYTSKTLMSENRNHVTELQARENIVIKIKKILK